MLHFKLYCCVVVALGTLVARGSAASYHFVNIADTRDPWERLTFDPQAVSDTAEVAFIARPAGGVTGSYMGDGTSTNSVAPDLASPTGFSMIGRFALNESGVAAAKFQKLSENRIQLYGASGTRLIAQTTRSGTVETLLWFPAINNRGAVAFGVLVEDYGRPPAFPPQVSITRWVDGTSTTILEAAEGFDLLGAVRLNEPGDVAFQGFKEGEGWAFYRTDGSTLTRIADSSGPLNIQQDALAGLAINDSGAVALWTRLDAGGQGIFLGSGGPLATVAIADSTTPFYEFAQDIDMNNHGTVAFAGRLWDGSFGIYTGADPVNDKVVEIGDRLFGQPVSSLGRPHLNERGDIGFWFTALDPRVPGGEWTGIALAVKDLLLTGDANGDGSVDNSDLAIVVAKFGTTSGATVAQGDFDNNGRVNLRDLLLLRNHFGLAQPIAMSPNVGAVPEPASCVLAAIGGLAIWLAARRRKDR
jgi:hypothetical protein